MAFATGMFLIFCSIQLFEPGFGRGVGVRRRRDVNKFTSPSSYLAYLSFGPDPWKGDMEMNTTEHFCAGALVSDRYVLTAASCERKEVKIVLGKDSSNPRLRSTYTVSNEDFISNGPLALVKLPKPAKINQAVRTIQLSKAAGYGNVQFLGWRKPRPDIRALGFNVSVVERKQCQKQYYSLNINKTNLCIERKNEWDSCFGTTGAILFHNTLRTLIAIGHRRSEGFKKDKPLVLTDIKPYRKWILEHINSEETEVFKEKRETENRARRNTDLTDISEEDEESEGLWGGVKVITSFVSDLLGIYESDEESEENEESEESEENRLSTTVATQTSEQGVTTEGNETPTTVVTETPVTGKIATGNERLWTLITRFINDLLEISEDGEESKENGMSTTVATQTSEQGKTSGGDVTVTTIATQTTEGNVTATTVVTETHVEGKIDAGNSSVWKVITRLEISADGKEIEGNIMSTAATEISEQDKTTVGNVAATTVATATSVKGKVAEKNERRRKLITQFISDLLKMYEDADDSEENLVSTTFATQTSEQDKTTEEDVTATTVATQTTEGDATATTVVTETPVKGKITTGNEALWDVINRFISDLLEISEGDGESEGNRMSTTVATQTTERDVTATTVVVETSEQGKIIEGNVTATTVATATSVKIEVTVKNERWRKLITQFIGDVLKMYEDVEESEANLVSTTQTSEQDETTEGDVTATTVATQTSEGDVTATTVVTETSVKGKITTGNEALWDVTNRFVSDLLKISNGDGESEGNRMSTTVATQTTAGDETATTVATQTTEGDVTATTVATQTNEGDVTATTVVTETSVKGKITTGNEALWDVTNRFVSDLLEISNGDGESGGNRMSTTVATQTTEGDVTATTVVVETSEQGKTIERNVTATTVVTNTS